jgi:hypothetical protein
MLQVCLFGCYICFTHMLQVLYLDIVYVLHGFQVFLCVSDTCFKCFICLQTYVTSVASGCFKSRLGVASRSLLTSVSLPSLGAGWTFEPKVQTGPAPPLLLDAYGAAGDKLPRVALASAPCVSWFHYAGGRAGAPSITLFRGSIAEIGRLQW